MADYQLLTHQFTPVYNKDSRILILGTFPSVKSREDHFYYGHPQNRFWKIMARLTESSIPATIQEKQDLLLKHHIALWDVIQSCEIMGSSDSSIRNVIPADIPGLLPKTSIRRIYGNGNKACELFEKYTVPALSSFQELQKIQKLPSTSPANASWTLERLSAYWKEQLCPYLLDIE